MVDSSMDMRGSGRSVFGGEGGGVRVVGDSARRCVDASRSPFFPDAAGRSVFLVLLLFAIALPAAGREKNKAEYGQGLTVSVPLPESEVEPVVEDVVQNGVIRGTKEYNKDEFVCGRRKPRHPRRYFHLGMKAARSSTKFASRRSTPGTSRTAATPGLWSCAMYSRTRAAKIPSLRIDALFQEDFRQIVHQSNGSVETAEYKDIQEHVEAIEVMKKQNVEAVNERREKLAKKQTSSSQADAGPWPVPQSDEPAVAAPMESHQDAAPGGTAQVASQSAADQSPSIPNQPIRNQLSQDPPSQDQTNQDQTNHESAKSERARDGRVRSEFGRARERSSPAARAAGERPGSAAEVRALPHREYAAVATHWHGSPDSDFHALLVRRGNARRTARMDDAR